MKPLNDNQITDDFERHAMGRTVQHVEDYKGYRFLDTYGHGYLVVPKDDEHTGAALAICEHGFEGKLAYYLEEDCEMPAFLGAIKKVTAALA